MAIKKPALYSSLWSSCGELRGEMYASQYKGDPYAMVEVPDGACFNLWQG